MRISVQPSRCHPLNLCLEVISSRPHRAQDAPAETGMGTEKGKQPKGRGRSELVQEVVRLAEEASQQAEEKRSRKPKLSKEEREFRQSKQPNLYSRLQEIADLALLDLQSWEACCVKAQTCSTTA